MANRMAERAPAALQGACEISVGQTTKFLAVIEQFGRFPHRNAIFGRESTPEELEFLVGWAERHPPANIEQRLNVTGPASPRA